jgi:hypothetical protein
MFSRCFGWFCKKSTKALSPSKGSIRQSLSTIEAYRASFFPPWGKPLFVAALFLAYSVVLYWKLFLKPGEVCGGLDMSIYYPFKLYWIDSLKNGCPALWNPYLSIGEPFLAFPSVEAYSPFNLLHLIFPQPFAFTLNSLAHHFLAAFGVYMFLTWMGCAWEAGFLGGMAFSFGAYFVSRSFNGQPAVWWAASWMPWVLYFLGRFLREKKFWLGTWACACAALCMFEGYPQITVYVLLVGGLYILGAYFFRWVTLGETLSAGVLLTAGFFFLAACQMLPAYEFISHSNRWTWDYKDIMSDYLTPLNLRHFLQPNFLGAPYDATWHGMWGYHEVVNYIGLIPLGLFFAGVFLFRRVPWLIWFWLVAALFLVLSLGDSTWVSQKVFRFFYDFVPGFSKNRSIGRMMVMCDFALACAAGLALNAWLQSNASKKETKARKTPDWKRWAVRALLVLTVLDLWHFGSPFIFGRPPGLYTDADQIFPPEVMKKVEADEWPRILPSNLILASLPRHIAQLSSPDTTILREIETFKVALPPSYESPLFDLIRLKYLHQPSLKPSERWKQIIPEHFENQKAYPRAFLAGGYQVFSGGMQEALKILGDAGFDSRGNILLQKEPSGLTSSLPGVAGEARIASYRDNEVVLECRAERPCLLFLSDPFFNGWKARLDGHPVELLRADGAFRAVVLPSAGAHQVRMVYRPPLVYIGFFISLLGWLGMVLLNLKGRRWVLDVRAHSKAGSLVKTVFGIRPG